MRDKELVKSFVTSNPKYENEKWADPAFASEESHSGGLVRTGFNSVTIRQRPGSGMIKTPMTPGPAG
ncbi:hypothetical protein EVAR_100388_1 [Eumeta japonica]|uniref:Uncharacterized protein n=1 Tax=Eumeta variegata TaxID=151549 RepID=A0A4C1TF65_EUMVA|nr:hypothetical protein EVAR_100388_1 [Eumeta japonica]